MPTIRETYLPILDKYRGMLATTWDLRRYDVVVRVRTWSGGLPGMGTATTTDAPLVVASGARPKVEQLSQRDILASAGLYADQDLRIGPFTPYSAGFTAGVQVASLDPATVGPSTEVLFKLTGPSCPAGAWFKAIGHDASKNFGLFVIVRKTAEQGP